MRIVIDLQGAQSTVSKTRGVGRYSSSLARAIARRAANHELVLALNDNFPDAVDEIKAGFDGLIDPSNVRVWHAAPHAISAGGRRAQEKLYEAFLASLQPDVVHISSLFEGLVDASVTSIGSFAKMPVAVTLYDLIPLINPYPYLENLGVRDWYKRKISALQRANMWLAISESSRQEAIGELGLTAERCVNVSTACSDHFRKLPMSNEQELAVRDRYGLRKPFVMYTGGIDHRKNLERLVRAYALVPGELRSRLQLAIVCSANSADKAKLMEVARQTGLSHGDVVITGFVPEQDLVHLYNLCTLFVFPSWHEGFGLPALEAMQCGAVVIGSNTSSVPEVIGNEDALFDPRSEASIAAKMVQALTDEALRTALTKNGLEQAKKFTWDESARKALEALEQLHQYSVTKRPAKPQPRKPRPRMAYVSPLPPERSGIAIYSAALLPELEKYYDIDLISDLTHIDDARLTTSHAVRSVEWFKAHASEFERVLYHFGNSHFHQHMFGLLAEIPGVVVLHDFFLGGVQAHREFEKLEAFNWTRTLYASHGYSAVAERFRAADLADIVFKYPCNFDVLQSADGVIVHSPFSTQLAQKWYGRSIASDWALVPLLHEVHADSLARHSRAREELGLQDDDILVCAFGLLGSTKLNHRLLDAWSASTLAEDPRCKLVFVGENDKGSYAAEIRQRVEASLGKITITGWADTDTFDRYLRATNIAVQLRTLSRGETSSAVLDAMSNGVATIVNANGSMAYLPTDAVRMLPDQFEDAQLVAALEELRKSPQIRAELGQRGRAVIQSLHAPAACARGYNEAIESFVAARSVGRSGLIRAISQEDSPAALELPEIAQAIALSLPLPSAAHQLLVDISELVRHDWKSGIQRLVKALLIALFDAPPEGFRIEPVYALDGVPGYRYARKFTLGFLGCPTEGLEDVPVDIRSGDIFIGLDLQPHIVPQQEPFFQKLRRIGGRVEFVVYDLLPVLLSHCFFEDAYGGHTRWLHAVAANDGALCISQAVAQELKTWMTENAPERLAAGFKVRTFHLGADLSTSKPTSGLPDDAQEVLMSIASRPSFLMVGTIEPRKGHEQTLKAFEQLWAGGGTSLNLVLIGKQGWMVDDLVERLRTHPEADKRLFWLQGISDEYLEHFYASCACLIAASEGEGFGLPLIEAARHQLPIIARDLPVFREVAGPHAMYFKGTDGAIAAAILKWLDLFHAGQHPRSDAMAYLTWQESAEQFKAALFDHDQFTPPQHTTSNF